MYVVMPVSHHSTLALLYREELKEKEGTFTLGWQARHTADCPSHIVQGRFEFPSSLFRAFHLPRPYACTSPVTRADFLSSFLLHL